MITYNKTFNRNVLENLTGLLSDEFRNTPIVYTDQFKGNTYFTIMPIEDTVIDLRTSGAIREYTLEIKYFQKKGGRYTKNKDFDSRIDIIERLKEILRRNTASVEQFLYMITKDGEDFLTSDSSNFVILKRPYYKTNQEQFLITSNGLGFTAEPEVESYQFHNARLESVNYDTDSENPNYLSTTALFKCLVEEVYS